MSKAEKLIERLKSKPKDFTYQELKTLMEGLGCYEDNKGKTSGSRIAFVNSYGYKLQLHKPHSSNALKDYQLIIVLKRLYDWGYLK